MMTNLFSIFDPSTSTLMSLNWLSMAMWLVVISMSFWLIPNYYNVLFMFIYNYIYSEFKPLINKSPQTLLICVTLFIFIMLNNVLGLLPYIFTATSHMAVTFSMALPLWIGMMVYSCVYNTSNLLAHLIPTGTPVILMPFMVLIETISNIIRPLTLAIRLSANMIAGHLLITLLMSASPMTPLLLNPIMGNCQMALASLEVAVAFIQAYVFSVLITLYASESIN